MNGNVLASVEACTIVNHDFRPTGEVGAWLSLVERLVRDQEVAGSNPVAPTIFFAQKSGIFSNSACFCSRLPSSRRGMDAFVPLHSFTQLIGWKSVEKLNNDSFSRNMPMVKKRERVIHCPFVSGAGDWNGETVHCLQQTGETSRTRVSRRTSVFLWLFSRRDTYGGKLQWSVG